MSLEPANRECWHLISLPCDVFREQPWPESEAMSLHYHERFCCIADPLLHELRLAGVRLGPSPYCTSMHRVFRASHIDLATQLSDFSTNYHE